MDETRLLSLLESLLGNGRKQGRGEYLFHCPACNHYKPKLIIKLDPNYKTFQSWHCWICQDIHGTKGKSLYALFKRFDASPEQISLLKEILGEKSFGRHSDSKDVLTSIVVNLPKEYIPLWAKNNIIERKHALLYLKNRGVTLHDILKYQIGFCAEGKYKNRIIVPSFDDSGKLNYFTARAFFEDTKLKYINPSASRNVIGFDLFINWQSEIILCEGVFDAIAIKRNAIPLFGKTVSDKLYEKIVMEHPPAVYIALDKDAIKNSIKITEKLLSEGLYVYIVKLGEKDPSIVGFEKINEVIKNNSVKIDFQSLMKFKLGLG